MTTATTKTTATRQQAGTVWRIHPTNKTIYTHNKMVGTMGQYTKLLFPLLMAEYTRLLRMELGDRHGSCKDKL